MFRGAKKNKPILFPSPSAKGCVTFWESNGVMNREFTRGSHSPCKRSLFCPARRLRVAVRLVKISSAIYKDRFRNCCAGLHIRLHGEKKKKKENGKKSGMETGGGGGGVLAENDVTWDESCCVLRRIVHRENTVNLRDTKSDTVVHLVIFIFKTSRLMLNIVGLSKSLCRCFLSAICQ